MGDAVGVTVELYKGYKMASLVVHLMNNGWDKNIECITYLGKDNVLHKYDLVMIWILYVKLL